MVDPTENEINAMLQAGKSGGDYLESIEKFDLSALTQSEYMTFIESVITTYLDELRNTPPF